MTARTEGGPRVNAKLTPEQVAAIMERREKGHGARRISNNTGIPYSQVAGVVYCGNGARTLMQGKTTTTRDNVAPARSCRPAAPR